MRVARILELTRTAFRPHPACPDGAADGGLAETVADSVGPHPPCADGEADRWAGIAENLIHHPHEADGVEGIENGSRGLAHHRRVHPGEPDGAGDGRMETVGSVGAVASRMRMRGHTTARTYSRPCCAARRMA